MARYKISTSSTAKSEGVRIYLGPPADGLVKSGISYKHRVLQDSEASCLNFMSSPELLRFMDEVIMLDCFLRQNAGLYTIWVVPSLNKNTSSVP